MKIRSNILIAFAALFIIFGGANALFAQDDEPVAGGYIEASVEDEAIITAAKFAIRRQSRTQKATIALVSIKKARQQLVAGMNYEVCMEITSKKKLKQKPVRQFVKTVVYRNLKDVYSLTSWKVLKKPEDCEK